MGMFDTIYRRQPLPDGLTAEDFKHDILKLVPAATPRDLREKLHAAAVKALDVEETKSYLAGAGRGGDRGLAGSVCCFPQE